MYTEQKSQFKHVHNHFIIFFFLAYVKQPCAYRVYYFQCMKDAKPLFYIQDFNSKSL